MIQPAHGPVTAFGGNMTQATVSLPFSLAFRACPTLEKTQQVPKELTFEGVTYVFTYENIRSLGMYKWDKKVSWGRSLLTHSGSRAACVQLKSHKQVSAPGLQSSRMCRSPHS